MRLSLIVLALSLALVGALVAALPAEAADDWSLAAFLKQESGWKGHGVGSSITETSTTHMPNMPNIPNMPSIPGMPKDGKMVSTTKTTLSKITKDGYVLAVETRSMGRTIKSTQTEKLAKNIKPKFTDGGEGTVKIGGTDYTCKIMVVANMKELMDGSLPSGGGGRGGMAPQMGKGKLYVHAKLGVLKMETTMSVMGQAGTMVQQTTKLAATHKIGEKTYAGREITTTVSFSMGTIKSSSVTSNALPIHSLKKVANSEMMGRKSKTVTEVSAYVKKPLAATTGGVPAKKPAKEPAK